MGIGVISLVTSQKREITIIPPPGPPFAADSAHNGLSVDGGGRIVLGNDVGDVTMPARLLNNREIITEDDDGNPFGITLNAFISLVKTLLRGDRVDVTGQDDTLPRITCTGGNSSIATIRATVGDDGLATITATANDLSVGTIGCSSGGTDVFNIRANGLGSIDFLIQNVFASQQINTTTLCTKFQSNQGAAFNGATVQVSGTHTYRKFDQSQNGALTLDRDLDSAKVIRNSGALTVDFPNFAGANFREGFFIDILVTNAAGITINAGAGRLIHFGDISTSVNGTLSATNVGAACRIYVVDSTTFYTVFFTGSWSLT